MSTVLYLVRHAESLPSDELPEPQWPLSERGRRQAEALREVLNGLGVGAIYSSPYPTLHCPAENRTSLVSGGW
jgi:broad specificity phosphatase PhoE